MGSTHHKHDFINHDHDHDHETLTGFIKIDNQTIFTEEFAKKPTQTYNAMVDVLKQLKNIKRVNENLKNQFNERKNNGKKKLTFILNFSIFQRTFKFSNSEKYERAREKFESFKYIFHVKLLRPQSRQGRFAAGRLPDLAWQPGQTSRDVPNVHFIYICRFFANRQLFSLAVNTFIH